MATCACACAAMKQHKPATRDGTTLAPAGAGATFLELYEQQMLTHRYESGELPLWGVCAGSVTSLASREAACLDAPSKAGAGTARAGI